MKTRTVTILAVLVVVAMIVEWKFAAFIARVDAIHNYHGICNGNELVGHTRSLFTSSAQ